MTAVQGFKADTPSIPCC